MKKLLIALVIIAALSAMLFAEAKDTPKKDISDSGLGCPTMRGPMNGNGPQGGMRMEMRQNMMEELKLTKEQMKKLEVLKTDHDKIMNTKQAELENLMIDKHIAMKADKFDQVKLINKSIAEIQLFIDNARVDHHAAMLKELTPEQKDKFKEMMPMGMGKGMGKGMGMEKGMKGCQGMGMEKGKGGCEGMGMHRGNGMNCDGDCK
jgi:Spy/CpxP family protein refolding chaperone